MFFLNAATFLISALCAPVYCLTSIFGGRELFFHVGNGLSAMAHPTEVGALYTLVFHLFIACMFFRPLVISFQRKLYREFIGETKRELRSKLRRSRKITAYKTPSGWDKARLAA